jgi:hypothetical protein
MCTMDCRWWGAKFKQVARSRDPQCDVSDYVSLINPRGNDATECPQPTKADNLCTRIGASGNEEVVLASEYRGCRCSSASHSCCLVRS